MSAPFSTSSVNAHTSFVPIKLGSSSDARIVAKPPKPPERPIMPYMRYSRKVWDSVKAQNPDLKMWAIGKIIGHKWRELSESARQVYQEEYEAEKADYEKAMKSYQCSPQYQAYLQSKAKEKGGSSKSAQPDPGVYIQPVEEDEKGDAQFSVKQLASIRFHRNNRLITEVFSQQSVPDLRSVVTTQRMTVLQRQVQSLAMHQKKLEGELQGLQNRFTTKKRKLEDANQAFLERLKRVCEQQPAVDEQRFQSMVDKAMDCLLAQYKDHLHQHQYSYGNSFSEASVNGPVEAQQYRVESHAVGSTAVCTQLGSTVVPFANTLPASNSQDLPPQNNESTNVVQPSGQDNDMEAKIATAQAGEIPDLSKEGQGQKSGTTKTEVADFSEDDSDSADLNGKDFEEEGDNCASSSED